MKVRIETSAITRKITLDDIVPEAERRALRAQMAREAVAEAAARNRRVFGVEPPRREFVDGREGAAFESVKPAGRIDVEWAFADESIRWITEALIQASPIGPGKNGHYKDSFVVLLDGMAIETSAPLPAQFDEVAILNTQPYARKIERGLSQQAPDGVFQAVAAVASRRFGNIVKIRFSYRAPLFGGIHEWAVGRARSGRPKEVARQGRTPAIIITPYR